MVNMEFSQPLMSILHDASRICTQKFPNKEITLIDKNQKIKCASSSVKYN